MRINHHSNTATGSSVPSAKAFYQVSHIDARWQIVRASNGHVFCVCRSQEEANRLAAALNHDCELDPTHHLESNPQLTRVS